MAARIASAARVRDQGEPVQPGELAQYIHEHIPLSKAMGVSVVAVEDDAITLQAPLEPNLNHRQTVFGGSASALAILASWSLLHVRLHGQGIADRLVIQRNSIRLPVDQASHSASKRGRASRISHQLHFDPV